LKHVHNPLAQKSPFLRIFQKKLSAFSKTNVPQRHLTWRFPRKLTLKLVHNPERSRIISLTQQLCQCWFKIPKKFEKFRHLDQCRKIFLIKKKWLQDWIVWSFLRDQVFWFNMSWLWIMWSLRSSINTRTIGPFIKRGWDQFLSFKICPYEMLFWHFYWYWYTVLLLCTYYFRQKEHFLKQLIIKNCHFHKKKKKKKKKGKKKKKKKKSTLRW